ncbi:DUF1573 domain-containing protein [Planctomicrobium sp. SH527]|uniref:DUF1573 domain-containing protein n=1 Tax=Planctomicrobium sp. SH527 TaxID=3448123 RepID=UPI003F5B8D4E
MKPLQTLAVIATLIVGLAILSWVFGRVAPTPPKQVHQHDSHTHDSESPDHPEEESAGDPDKDHYRQNPFKIGTGENQPKAEVPEIHFAFGRMALGETGKHDFVVKNVGKAPLKLARGPAQCKCTVSGLKEQEIPPGGQTVIHLAWTPKDIGEFSQSATIYSNDPTMAEINLGVSGEMFPEIIVTPTTGWNLGPFSNSNDIPLVGSLESSVIEKFAITKIEVPDDKVKLEAIPYSAEELEQRGLRVGYHLKGHLKGIEAPTTVKESVVIHTDLEKHPKFELEVTGTRTGALTIIGPNWFAGGPLIELGSIEQGKGKEVKFTVMISPGDEELKLTEVTADPGYVTARLKPEQTGKELARERYSLFVSVPPNSPKGIWTSSNPGKLVLKTNHPNVKELEIKLHLNVD